jgi:hypothetical protein
MMNTTLLSVICVTLPCLAVLLQHGTFGTWKTKEQADCVLNSPGHFNPLAVINYALHSSNNFMCDFNNGHVHRMSEGDCV